MGDSRSEETMASRAAIDPGLPRDLPTMSYWQTPPSDIADEGQDAPLPTYADTVIVGSGISGAGVAHYLLNHQEKIDTSTNNPTPTSDRSAAPDIVMLEARQTTSGATGRNGGHTKAASYRTFPLHAEHYGVDEAIKIARLEYDNIRETHGLAASLKIDCESRPCQTVDVIYDAATFRAATGNVALMREYMDPEEGAAKYTRYDVENSVEKAAIESRFLTPVTGGGGKEGMAGAFEYEAGSISAYKFTTGLLKHAIARGLKLYTHTALKSFAPASKKSTEHASARWCLTTTKGAIYCRTLILATNAYTSHLLTPLRGKIVPLRGQVTAQKPSSTLQQLRPRSLEHTYSLVYKTGYEYMIPQPYLESVRPADRGNIIIGGGVGKLPKEGLSEYGNTDDTSLNPGVSSWLADCLPTYFGQNWGEDCPEERVKADWSGIMGVTADGLPFVGEVPLDLTEGVGGLWVTAGFNGHGMVLCLKSAEALAGMVVGVLREQLSWFPKPFLISKERLDKAQFDGRQGLRIDGPPEVVTAE